MNEVIGPCSMIRELVPIVTAFFSMVAGVLTIFLTHVRWKERHTQRRRISDRIRDLDQDEKERVLNDLIRSRIVDSRK
jgi:hypothetical protein